MENLSIQLKKKKEQQQSSVKSIEILKNALNMRF